MKWITVSRKMGTTGAQIASRVAHELGYRLYDTEAINQTTREMGVLESVKEVDEKPPSLFQRLFSQRPTVDYDRLDVNMTKYAADELPPWVPRLQSIR